MKPPRLVTRAPGTVIGLHRAMTWAEHDIPGLWRTFRSRLAEVQGRSSDHFVNLRAYGPLQGRPPGPTTPFEQWAAVEVDASAPVPEGMDRRTVEGGPYAVFVHEGTAAAFADSARWIHGTWLPASEWELDDRPHFEILPADYRPDDPHAREEVWLPVRRRAG